MHLNKLLQKRLLGAGKNVFLGSRCGTCPYFLQLEMLFLGPGNRPTLKISFNFLGRVMPWPSPTNSFLENKKLEKKSKIAK
jgi:hypothetical protein